MFPALQFPQNMKNCRGQMRCQNIEDQCGQKNIAWAVYHSLRKENHSCPPAVCSMLPHFPEQAFPEVTDALCFIVENPFQILSVELPEFKLLQRFVIILYNQTSELESLNSCRMELFCKQDRSMEKLPPTENAFTFCLQFTSLEFG